MTDRNDIASLRRRMALHEQRAQYASVQTAVLIAEALLLYRVGQVVTAAKVTAESTHAAAAAKLYFARRDALLMRLRELNTCEWSGRRTVGAGVRCAFRQWNAGPENPHHKHCPLVPPHVGTSPQ
jgi:hypothetical protein